MQKAFDLFEAAALVLAPPHTAEADAPASLAGIRAARAARGLYVVSNENSAATIFSSPAGNFAFRAWHDAAHDECGGDFDLGGEVRTWRLQREQLRDFAFTQRNQSFDARLDMLERILHCEVLGQLAHYQTWGAFPSDQRAFTVAFLQSGGKLERKF